jgi:hypothetical protein
MRCSQPLDLSLFHWLFGATQNLTDADFTTCSPLLDRS